MLISIDKGLSKGSVLSSEIGEPGSGFRVPVEVLTTTDDCTVFGLVLDWILCLI